MNLWKGDRDLVFGYDKNIYIKNFMCKNSNQSYCNAHLLRELISSYESTEQVWTEMILGEFIAGLDEIIKKT